MNKTVNAAIVTLILTISGQVMAGQERPDYPDEKSKLQGIREELKNKKLVSVLQPESEFCRDFMKDLFTEGRVEAIEPIVTASSKDDPRLKAWHRCDDAEPQDMKTDDPKYGYNGMALYGPPFRYYKIELDGNLTNGKEDVLYHEMIPSKHGGVGTTGYTWVDLKGCAIRDEIPISSLELSRNAPRELPLLSLIVQYRDAPMVVNISPDYIKTKFGYSIEVTHLIQGKKPRLCAWQEQE